MESIKELKKICYKNGKPEHFIRYISIYLTKLLLYTRITPNQITVFWSILGIIGATLFIINSYITNIIATLLLILTFTLDKTDGQIARYKKKFSRKGLELDWSAGRAYPLLTLVFITLGVYTTTKEFWVIPTGLFATFGFAMSIIISCMPKEHTYKNPAFKNEKSSSQNIRRVYLFLRKILLIDQFLFVLLALVLINHPEIFLIFVAATRNLLWGGKFIHDMLKKE